MDLNVTDWLVSTEDAGHGEEAQLAAAGEVILRSEPTLSPTVAAECHLRLAVLLLGTDDAHRAGRHAAHACTLMLDAPNEAQLHTLPRAVGVLRTATMSMVDVSPSIAEAQTRAEAAVAGAMQTSIDAADRAIVRFAVLAALDDELAARGGSRREAVTQAFASVALELESAGEQALADDASRRSVPAP